MMYIFQKDIEPNLKGLPQAESEIIWDNKDNSYFMNWNKQW